MEFKEFTNQNGVSYLKDYLDTLETKDRIKILDKLILYEKLSFLQLSKDGKLKHLEGKLYEMRVRVGNAQYRFLGTTHEGDFWIVHCFLKKSDRIKKKDKEIGMSRINQLLIK
ncbi:MAG TPA: type II toxin-antitoxin system RelE/ParE family toxin [Candidatus Paceibacterota bacterium]